MKRIALIIALLMIASVGWAGPTVTVAPGATAADLALKLTTPSGTSNTIFAGGATTNEIYMQKRAMVSTDIPAGVTLTTPNIGAATGTSLILTGNISGKSNVVFMTGATTTHTVSSTSNSSAYYFQNGNTTVQLPTAAAGLQYCFKNYTGITAALLLYTSAGGQYIDLDGTNSASGGRVKTAGAAGDGICLVGADATQWVAWCSKGTCSLD